MEFVQFVPQLGIALWNLKVMYDQHVENGNEIKELQSFIQDYDHQIPILRERFQENGGNVMGTAAFKNLEKDVMEATNKLERWSRNESFFRLFNSAERMQKLGKLHSKIMASVQKCLGIANLSVLLDLQATQATILESNAELKSLLITNIGSMHGMLPTEVRDEVVEASTSSFADLKFWEDILSAVDNHNASVSSIGENNMYEDPITTNLMIDPIVASDGNTYCRWTIIDNNLTKNPFNVDEDLTITIDNLTFRRGLFEKFPEQAQIFRQRRNQYRSHALTLKAKGSWGDAILALHYVLQWDKRDIECVEALKEVQGALHEAQKKYLKPSMGLSTEPNNGGPSNSSMQKMVVGTYIELHEAYKLFPSLSSCTSEVRQMAASGICQWSFHVKLQSYIVKNGGIPLLAALLPSSNQITQEYLISILLDVSRSSHKRRTIFGTVKPNFSDALEPIAKILMEGSTGARELAALLLFNLSTSLDRMSVIGNSFAMLALVTSLSDGTHQVQQFAIDTLNNLFPDALEPIAHILKEGSTKAQEQVARIFFNLSTNLHRKSVLENPLALFALTTLLLSGAGTLEAQQLITDTLYNLCPDLLEPIAKILMKGSTEAREQAAWIFLNLSKSIHRWSIVRNSTAMTALVTCCGNETLQVQKNIVVDAVNNLFPDALEPIAKILKEGSTKVREQAARILFTFSTSLDRINTFGWNNVGDMSALVTSLGNGTLQLQQIVASTLNNFCRHDLKVVQAIEAGLVPMLMKLIVEQPSTMLEEALPLVYKLLTNPNSSMLVLFLLGTEIERARPKIWLSIMTHKSPVNRERAASIFYTLCYNDHGYKLKAELCSAPKKITYNFDLSMRTKQSLFELFNSNVSDWNYPRRSQIPFPEKDWWSPRRD